MPQTWLSVAVLLVAIGTRLAPADESPRFLRARRDGISGEKGLIDAIPADGPKPIWRVPGRVHLVCLEAKTGLEVWRKPRFGKVNMVYADWKLLITTFEGELVLARATPAGYAELGRAELLGRTRQTLTIAGGIGYLRDDREVLCFGLE